MRIKSKIENSFKTNRVSVKTGDHVRVLKIPSKASGFGSDITGGELLLLAMATCFCNVIYREAEKRNIRISGVEVVVEGEFLSEGVWPVMFFIGQGWKARPRIKNWQN